MAKQKPNAHSYREFLIGWIGIHIVCALLFMPVALVMFVIAMMSIPKSVPVLGNQPLMVASLMVSGNLAGPFALVIMFAILSTFQYYISRRTIGVLPRSWLVITLLVLFIGVAINGLGATDYILAEARNRASLNNQVAILLMPAMYATFALVAIGQSVSLRRYGFGNAVLWALASGVVIVVSGFTKRADSAILYFAVHAFVSAVLCWHYWRAKDTRQKNADYELTPRNQFVDQLS